jgi:hypothetical protein
MSWVAPVAATVTAIAATAAGRQASAAGKYNQDIQNRNAKVLEQDAQAIEQKKEFDIARFDKEFVKLQGETTTKLLFSGVELSGTGLEILANNAKEAEIEKDLIEYNANINKSRKFEEANFARIRGNIARNNARAAELGYYAQAGTSLLTGFG